MNGIKKRICMINLVASYVFIDIVVGDKKTKEQLDVYRTLVDLTSRLRFGWQIETAGSQTVSLKKEKSSARYRFWGGYPMAVGLLGAAKTSGSMVLGERAGAAVERQVLECEALVYELHTSQYVFEISWPELSAIATLIGSGRITDENIITWQDMVPPIGELDIRNMFLPDRQSDQS